MEGDFKLASWDRIKLLYIIERGLLIRSSWGFLFDHALLAAMEASADKLFDKQKEISLWALAHITRVYLSVGDQTFL